MSILVPISIGELIDKVTILEIKKRLIKDPAKLVNIEKEYQFLCSTMIENDIGYPSGEIANLGKKLSRVNNDLWLIEDQIRDCERAKKFDARFIELARSVYIKNDQRASLKAQINRLVSSDLIEEKSYAAY